MVLDRRPPATAGLLFSASGFTVPAVHEAQVQPVRNVLLWAMSDVDLALRRGMRAALSIKWRKAVEEAEMDYELEGEDFR